MKFGSGPKDVAKARRGKVECLVAASLPGAGANR